MRSKMQTFSPNYNTISIMIQGQYPKCLAKERPLNRAGMLPVSGGFVAVYRATTGIADLVSGLFKLISLREHGRYQAYTGLSNIIRASIEVIPTVMLINITSHNPLRIKAMIISVIAVPVILTLRDHLSQGLAPTTAPVAAFFDGELAVELTPKNSRDYSYEGWLEQLNKHGDWKKKYFV